MIVRWFNKLYKGTPRQVVEFLKRKYIRYTDSKTNKEYRTGTAQRVRQLFEQDIDTSTDLVFLHELAVLGELIIIEEDNKCAE